MTEFLLRIFFTGLMVFVPNEEQHEVTVLLLNVPHQHELSDTSEMDDHKPLLIASGGSCSGTCPTNDTTIAEWLYPDKTTQQALASLAATATGGGAWQLEGSDLTLAKGDPSDPALPALNIVEGVRGTVNGEPKIIPTTSAERADFSWVANLKELCPSCSIDEDVFAEDPSSIVAARFTLRNGDLSTYSIARIGGDVTPVHFKRLDDTGSVSDYTQAVAVWTTAEVAISAESVQIVEEKFNGGTGRTMELTPNGDGVVEVAVLNTPPLMPPLSPSLSAPEVGKHFEMYYEIAESIPTANTRLVPRAGAAPDSQSYPQVSWDSIHPEEDLSSDLLNDLRLGIGRTISERIICPPGQNPWP